MVFERSVFINCPFDESYVPILRAILFCIVDIGLEPRIALERFDSGEPRIEKIIELIEGSKFGIHDLSRLQAKSIGEFYRMNMPFELGLDVGCRRFKEGMWASKRCLILETERFRYQAALSDLSNSDIMVHGDEPAVALSQVRHWLNAQVADLKAPGPSRIWQRFNLLEAWNVDRLTAEGFSREDTATLLVGELIARMRDWRARTS